MNPPQPLAPDQLYHVCDASLLPFETTSELADGLEIIGQARAVDAIRFGIGIDHHGYNLFALGPNGIGRQTIVNRFLSQRAAGEPTPDDWCYVYNFEQPHKPRAHRLPPGRAVVFRDDMKQLSGELLTVLPATFAGEEYQLQKRGLEEELRGLHTEALETLRAEAQTHSIALIQTPGGFAFAPLKEDGEVISPDEFMRLDQEAQKKIEAEVGELQESLQRIMQQIPNLHRDMQKRLRELNERVVEFTIAPLLEELRQKYTDLPGISQHLDDVQKDIVENYEAFVQEDESNGRQLIGAIMGMTAERKPSVSRYEVNVVIDNSQTQGAPVIFLDQPRYQNLVGMVEHVAQMGALVTDFTLIKRGALHEANGGYLLIDALKLLSEPYAWEGLKRALRKSEIAIESIGQAYSLISTISLEPEPIPLDVKVVLIGERLLYYLLSGHDLEFNELFKVSADFEDVIERGPDSALAYARLIAEVSRAEKLRPFDRPAVARVVEHGSRLAEDARKLSTHMQSITDLLREANYWAAEAGREIVQREDVQKVLDTHAYHAGRVPERIQESILRGQVLIDTAGAVVGQVNGLSVNMVGNHAFGRPTRITARARLGGGEVIDIEREVDMGGPIHSKGVLILSGFLGQRYAAEQPLSLMATLVFEQSYGGIEGDSASSAELYALLSALSGAPIKQSLGVTGSVDQRGQVQTIGGVNEKIEGFFDVCRARGLTGDQGVLIPAANVENLMLRHDVVEAARAGQFHIYPIATVDEGIALLTGIAAGEVGEDGAYPADSINGRVMARLAVFADKQRAFNETGRGSPADGATKDEGVGDDGSAA
ncbi:Peptidase S16 lon domain protein [Candidatus Promineifilum breve]|uniref:endopeptidase La n=1 Tax=Candidatus Promineifilum breve TaxID=1806508 RepID=A0A160SYZ3_9CHLR|nr:ATP-binding protein [Candidatus Promineifilum breve]CUS02324.2 Peptidase S16 lon domain protein [Candidatus Promineifilum breve]